jgi:hypothetical protein
MTDIFKRGELVDSGEKEFLFYEGDVVHWDDSIVVMGKHVYACPRFGRLIEFDSRFEMECYRSVFMGLLSDEMIVNPSLKPGFSWMPQLKRGGRNRTMRRRRYTPDFMGRVSGDHTLLDHKGRELGDVRDGEPLVIEVKGYYRPIDRMKIQGWGVAHPMHNLLMLHQSKDWELFEAVR